MKFWLRLFISVTLVVVLLGMTDWRAGLSVLASASIPYAITAFLLSIIGVVISAIRWNLLLAAHDILLTNFRANRIYFIGSFFGNYLPSSIGGDVVRIIAVDRPDKLAQTASSVIVERITGMIVLLILVVVGISMRPEYYRVDALLPLIWMSIGSLVFATVVLVLFGKKISRAMVLWGDRGGVAVAKLVDKLRKLVDGINLYSDARTAVIGSTLWAVLFYGNLILFQYVILLAVGSDLPLREVALVAPLIPLVSFLPISINAIGVAEGTFVFLYVQAGLDPETALAGAALRRALLLLTSLIGGLFWLSDRKRPESIELMRHRK